ncbi:MAG: hypothetical protein SFZ03_10420 [Candidatus Melainabacteria bacterium]|nr:hypothetical protein [Candidatus Melainabacteria bacterium]
MLRFFNILLEREGISAMGTNGVNNNLRFANVNRNAVIRTSTDGISRAERAYANSLKRASNVADNDKNGIISFTEMSNYLGSGLTQQQKRSIYKIGISADPGQNKQQLSQTEFRALLLNLDYWDQEKIWGSPGAVDGTIRSAGIQSNLALYGNRGFFAGFGSDVNSTLAESGFRFFVAD